MTEPLFLKDAYRTEAEATVTGHTQEGGIVLDASIFYATGGGKSGDGGRLNALHPSLDSANVLDHHFVHDYSEECQLK